MYTEEDFWRDYPPTDEPFLSPWLKDYHDEEEETPFIKVHRAAAFWAQKAAEEVTRKAVEKALIKSKMDTARALLAMGMDVSMISQATGLSEEQILSLKEAATV